jgi:hypothetical protein
MFKKLLLMTIAVLFCLTANVSFSYSQDNEDPFIETINYQGHLIDRDGSTIDDGNYNITFSIYENADDAQPLWSETQNIEIFLGYFNVMLGVENSFANAGIKFDKSYYLGITFENEPEFRPRTMFSFVPYAFTAKKLIFPYKDTIKSDKGIDLTMQTKGVALNINKENGEALVITNTGEKSLPAVMITDDGRGGALRVSAKGLRTSAGIFSSDNQNSRFPTVNIANNGKGSALYLTNTFEPDTMPVIQLVNYSMGYGMLVQSLSEYDNKPAIRVDAMGIGGGASFRILKKDNNEPALVAQNWGLGNVAEFHSYNKDNINPALVVTTVAKGPAASFAVLDKFNDTTALTLITKGTGNTAEIFLDNKASESNALYIESNGTGPVLFSKATNKTNAAYFESNDSSDKATVEIVSNSESPALLATNVKGNSAADFIIPEGKRTKEAVVTVDHLGGGRALYVHSTSNPLEPALYVKKEGINGVAAILNGHVTVNGELRKMSGSFVIDHPLDPDNKLLSHSFVESPDMKNIYDGIVVLDDNGEASVTLPDWFQALNKDFRYQLTCIGSWAQVYISEEINNNTFKIAGGKPGMKVSWMVTGIRHDPWAEQHRIKVEKTKQKKGTYLFPEYYNNK